MGNEFNKEELLTMESKILMVLQFNLSYISPLLFID